MPKLCRLKRLSLLVGLIILYVGGVTVSCLSDVSTDQTDVSLERHMKDYQLFRIGVLDDLASKDKALNQLKIQCATCKRSGNVTNVDSDNLTQICKMESARNSECRAIVPRLEQVERQMGGVKTNTRRTLMEEKSARNGFFHEVQDRLQAVADSLIGLNTTLVEERVVNRRHEETIARLVGEIENVTGRMVLLENQETSQDTVIASLLLSTEPLKQQMSLMEQKHNKTLENLLEENETVKKQNSALEDQLTTMKVTFEHHVQEQTNDWEKRLLPFVLSLMDGGNLAEGKQTWASSYRLNTPSSRGVDGNRDGNWYHASCTHTENELDPLWMVDLGNRTLHVVGRVLVANRADCCGERLRHVHVTVHRERETEGELCGIIPGPGQAGQLVSLKCREPLLGRYLKVQIKGPGGTDPV